MEDTKKIGNIILTIVVLLALGCGIYYLVSRNDTDTAQQPTPGTEYYVSIVQVKHQFKDGEHIYVGALDLPNACYSLGSSIDKMDETAGVLKLVTEMNTEEACAQMVTSRTFREDVNGDINFAITGTLNGRPIELNIFEVPADQDIDAFEINIKG